MDDERSENSSSILSRIVGVIPSCAIEISNESIREAWLGCYWALLDSWDAVHPPGYTVSVMLLYVRCRLDVLTVKSFAKGRANACWALHRNLQSRCGRSLLWCLPWKVLIISPDKELIWYYQFASIRGPGNCPLIKMQSFVYPSGAHLPRRTVHSCDRVNLDNVRTSRRFCADMRIPSIRSIYRKSVYK